MNYKRYLKILVHKPYYYTHTFNSWNGFLRLVMKMEEILEYKLFFLLHQTPQT